MGFLDGLFNDLDSFFDDVVVNARTAANTVGKKANQIKDYSKLKYSESGIKVEIDKKKQELGDYIYSCSKTGDIDKAVMQSFVREIDELEENLQVTREMLSVTRNRVTCKCCKTENDRDAAYCCKCGNKLEVDFATNNNCSCKNDDVTVAASPAVEETKDCNPEDLTIAKKDTVTLEKTDVVESTEEAKSDNVVENPEQ